MGSPKQFLLNEVNLGKNTNTEIIYVVKKGG